MTHNDFASLYVDLAQPRLGAEVLMSTDDFFAEHHNLIKPQTPIFIPDKFTDRGKWMDGWESRRKRTFGHDYCIVRICRGVIRGINIDTSHFTGNFPESASIDACDSESDPDESTEWQELVPQVRLNGDAHNIVEIDSNSTWTHLRLNIYPDGGIARLRVYGEVFKNWSAVSEDDVVDLVGMENGGVGLACSDMHFGNVQNLTAPGRAPNMGDGWETSRHRGPGHEWAILKLGTPGYIEKIVIDTLHFKGNYPARCALRGTYAPGADVDFLTGKLSTWTTILKKSMMQADQLHEFDEIKNTGPVTHVRLDIYPDGGVGRLRLFGKIQLENYFVLLGENLTAEAFRPYGDVIEIEDKDYRTINDGYADRFENFTELDVTDGGAPAMSIFRARPVSMPFLVKKLERHPRSSQLFLPTSNSRFVVLVAEPSDKPKVENLRLFVTNGKQGVNYHRGVWHHFLLTLDEDQMYYVIDRSNPDDNTEEHDLDMPMMITKQSIPNIQDEIEASQ